VHDLSQFRLVTCGGGKRRAVGASVQDCGTAIACIESDAEVQLESCQIVRNGTIETQVLYGKLTVADCGVKNHKLIGIYCKA
jgi:hypothetical protein